MEEHKKIYCSRFAIRRNYGLFYNSSK